MQRQCRLLLGMAVTAAVVAEAVSMLEATQDVFADASAVLSACKLAMNETAANYLKVTSAERVLRQLTNGFLDGVQKVVGTIILSLDVSPLDRVVLLLVDSDLTMYCLLDKAEFWSPSAYYVILIASRIAPILDIQRQLWNMHRIYHAFFAFAKEPSKLFFYDPFKNCEVQGSANELIPINKEAAFQDMGRAPLRIAYFIRNPSMRYWGKHMVGSDGWAMNILAKKMNVTPRFVAIPDGKRYGYKFNNTFYGSLGSLVRKEADIAGNGHFIKDYDTDKIEFSHIVGHDRLNAIVPKADKVKSFSLLLKFFRWEVWLTLLAFNTLLGACYAGSSRLSALLLRKQPTGFVRLALLTFQLALSVPTHFCHALLSQRILLSATMLLSLVMVSTFQASMVTFLRNPIYQPDISTLEQLIRADVRILTTSPELGYISRGEDLLDALHKKIRIVTPATLHRYSAKAKYARVARVSSVMTGMFMDTLPPEDGWPRHMVQQSLISYYIAYLLPRGSPFNPRINQIVSRFKESGFYIKWAHDISVFHHFFGNNLPDNSNDPIKPYTIGNLSFAFELLVCGLMFSVVVFVFELFIYKQSRCK